MKNQVDEGKGLRTAGVCGTKRSSKRQSESASFSQSESTTAPAPLALRQPRVLAAGGRLVQRKDSAMTVSQVSSKLNIGRAKVLRLIGAGNLQAVDINAGGRRPTYRITAEALADFIAGRVVRAVVSCRRRQTVKPSRQWVSARRAIAS